MPKDDAHALLANNPACVEAVDSYLQAHGKPCLKALPPELAPVVAAAVLDKMVDDEVQELVRAPQRELEESTARSLNLLDELEQYGIRPWTLAQLEQFFADQAA